MYSDEERINRKNERRTRLRQRRLQQKLENAITIQEDTSLPSPIFIRIRDAKKYVGRRVELKGWLQSKPRRPNSRITFIELIDDPTQESLQCVLTGNLCKTRQAILFDVKSTTLTYSWKNCSIQTVKERLSRNRTECRLSWTLRSILLYNQRSATEFRMERTIWTSDSWIFYKFCVYFWVIFGMIVGIKRQKQMELR